MTLLRINYTRIKIAVVYHEYFESWGGDWADLRINSSQEALEAYREGISSNYYVGKEEINISAINNKILPLTNRCNLGFFPGWGDLEDDVKGSEITNFEALSGKSVAFVPFSIFWGENYSDSKNLDIITNYDAIPMLRLMPWGEPYWDPYGFQPDYSLQRIIDGYFDDFLKDWAEVLKDFSKPVMVTFGVEMNGDWFPWSGYFQGNSTTDKYGDPTKPDGPERYVDAFRHVYEVINNSGATNVTWYFHVNYESIPEEWWNNITLYYPGNKYVDWIATSLYGPLSEKDEYHDFHEIMDPIYNELTNSFPNKPIMLAEWGIREP
ncbi:MAG: glycoside hydrolase family 26 protein [Promethearchaeia archaeon]